MTVLLRKGNPNQLLIYSMEVNIYIGFWTMKMKCTQYGLSETMTFKDARVRPSSRGEGFGFFGVAHARCLDKCSARRGYLDRPILRFSCWESKWLRKRGSWGKLVWACDWEEWWDVRATSHTSQEPWPWKCNSPKESIQWLSQHTSKIM